ncbi:MAG: efflux transporter outer membrane subunit [Candidatus Acidiferrales bacterium]
MRKHVAIGSAIVVACTLAGCAMGPKYHPPVTQAPASFKESPTNFKNNGPWTIAQPQDTQLRSDWWTIFKDPELNALEAQLNINNQTIREYFENFMEARTLVGEAHALYYPTLSIGPSYTRSKSSGNLTHTASANTGFTSSIYELPLEASWEPDLWGKVRKEVRYTEYEAQVSGADLAGERLGEQTALAQYFFEIHGQDALIDLYNQTIKAYTESLTLTQAQYETGITDKISVTEAQNTLQTAEATLTSLGIARAEYEHAIAVLVGKPASQFSIPHRGLAESPPPIPIGVPSLLLERRPDIAAAERLLAADNAELGVAYAAFYPALTLSVGGGTETSLLHQIASWPSRFWSIGGSLSQPLYNAELQPALRQYVAIYNANLADYRETVLTAFQQVEDYLAATRILSKQVVQQEQAVKSAQQDVELETYRYKIGIDPYIDVVALQDTLLGDEQTLVSLQITQMTDAVTLVQALGGGWDVSQLPTPAQVAQKPPSVETRLQH